MIDAQRRIVSTACFSPNRVAEIICYNGKFVQALCEIGATLARTDWNDMATTVEEARLADSATFSVLDTEVPSPQEGDSIIYNEDTYTVVRITNHDIAGGHFVIDAIKEGRAFGR